ncbi:MAG: hypothetical protein R2695_01640 [Acidimicrobiales bacterium]
MPSGDAELTGLLEAMRSLHIDCWIAARRHDRHFGVHRLDFHTARYWAGRAERLDRYLAMR